MTDYSERGYTSLQNLIDLITLVNQGKAPDTVIYYGGAADIWVHCNDTVTSLPNSHMEEHRIRAAIGRTASGSSSSFVNGHQATKDRLKICSLRAISPPGAIATATPNLSRTAGTFSAA